MWSEHPELPRSRQLWLLSWTWLHGTHSDEVPYLDSQMALCLWASMDALVVSSSSRALLAFPQSSIASTGGVMLSGLEAVAMGEMLVGIPSRDACAISALA